MKFSDFSLQPSLLAGIEKLKFEECTPVQAATIPHILEGKDIAGLAQTGTGKTAAFLLPLMERILQSRLNPDELDESGRERQKQRAFSDWRSNQWILILVPTRELAEQVYENIEKLKGTSEIRSVSVYGGVSYDKQKQAFRDGVEVVVATPGRLIDLFKEHLIDLKNVRAIVFDEADRMFDMGFKDDMKYILQRIPKERQFLVFSATLNLEVTSVAYQFGANPVEVNVSRDQAKAENVEDEIFHLGHTDKPMYLLSVLKKMSPKQAIIFSNFKMNVPRIAQFLNENKISAVGISSLLSQAQRLRVMEQFKGDNDCNVLIATDVAARGLDIKGVDLVVNYELPDDPENYVHRIGRTGRAGASGKAFSFVSDRDVEALSRIEDYLRHKVKQGWLDDADMVKEFRAFPSDRSARSGGRDRGENRGEGRGEGRGDRGPRDQRNRGGEGRRGEHPRRPERDGEFKRGARPQREQTGSRPPEREANGEPRQHRDKQMGRHRDSQNREGRPQQQRRDQRPPQQGQQRGGPHDRSREGQRDSERDHQRSGAPQRSQAHRGSRPQRAGSSPGTANTNQQVSIGKKVSNFIKKIFGGSSTSKSKS